MATRKKNRQDDDTLVDLIEVKESTQDFLDRNQKMISGVLGGLALLVAGYFAYSTFIKKPKEATAAEQMYQAQFQFERDSFTLALTNPGNGYPGFLDIIDQYGSTKAGNLANFYAGVSYLHLGKFEAAIAHMEDFSASGKFAGALKYGVIGDAYAELNDMDKAMQYYKRASETGENDDLKAYYLKRVAQLFQYQGKNEEAKAAFEKLKAQYSETPVVQDIEKYILRVSKG